MHISPGDRMPFCVALYSDRRLYSFDSQAGRPAVLVLGGGVAVPSLDPIVSALAVYETAFSALGADVRVLQAFSDGPLAWQPRSGNAAAIPVLLSPDDYFRKLGAAGAPAIVVIDRAARVGALWPLGAEDPAMVAAAALEAICDLSGVGAEGPPAEAMLPAPVLMLPGLFDAAFCRALIAGFEAAPHFASLVSGSDAEGRPHDRVDVARKQRRDWALAPQDSLYQQVRTLLLRRCAPEIHRAFHCNVTCLDRVLVARYDDSGGYFRRHRDNLGERVAFRQFALSVNLNTGEYEGGALSFPEFNDHRYAPKIGEGLVFSASLLHEALPVTRGRRYVLLTFLHDAAAEQRRLAATGAAVMELAEA